MMKCTCLTIEVASIGNFSCVDLIELPRGIMMRCNYLSLQVRHLLVSLICILISREVFASLCMKKVCFHFLKIISIYSRSKKTMFYSHKRNMVDYLSLLNWRFASSLFKRKEKTMPLY